ncbi:MAG TPA: histidine kinase [Puia sp.]|nr:histidine kinase [Puia sp.]
MKASSVIAHCVVWLIFLSLPLLFISNQPEGASIISVLFSLNYFIFFITYIAAFYFNALFLVPQFYLKKKFGIYLAVIFLMIIIISFVKPFDGLLSGNPPPRMPQRMENTENFREPPKPDDFHRPPDMAQNHPPRRIDAISIFLLVMVIGVSTAISITQTWHQTEQRASRAEADKANAELSFLKAQINPHFLFNTLNNIYSLAVTKNENTADCIMKLSNIMRYVTDEATEDYVLLQDEIDCITDYIGLQKIRLGDKANINLEIKGNVEQKKITPLILMSFIENVFKYGVSKHEPSGIDIKLFAEAKTITFFCRNRIFNSSIHEERKGVGIENAKKRLEYLYHDRHFLNISNENSFYTVQLTLQV